QSYGSDRAKIVNCHLGPMSSNQAFVEFVRGQMLLASGSTPYGLLVITRRWGHQQLGTSELVGVLLHCANCCCALLHDCERFLLTSGEVQTSTATVEIQEWLTSALPDSLTLPEEYRSATYRLDTCETRHIVIRPTVDPRVSDQALID